MQEEKRIKREPGEDQKDDLVDIEKEKEVKELCVFNQEYFDWLEDHVVKGRNSNCTCNDCYAMKCRAYEIVKNEVAKEYELYKAVVAKKRGDVSAVHTYMTNARAAANRNFSDQCYSINEKEWKKEYDQLNGRVVRDSELRYAVTQVGFKPQFARFKCCEGLVKYLRANRFNFFLNNSRDEETNHFRSVLMSEYRGPWTPKFW